MVKGAEGSGRTTVSTVRSRQSIGKWSATRRALSAIGGPTKDSFRKRRRYGAGPSPLTKRLKDQTRAWRPQGLGRRKLAKGPHGPPGKKATENRKPKRKRRIKVGVRKVVIFIHGKRKSGLGRGRRGSRRPVESGRDRRSGKVGRTKERQNSARSIKPASQNDTDRKNKTLKGGSTETF